MSETEKKFQRIQSTYAFWGKTGLYNPGAFLTFLGRERTIRRECVRQLQLKKGDRVVDIACGTGRNHPYLIEAVGKEGSIIGFDFTLEMLARARAQAEAQGWRNVTFVQGDAAEIDLPSASFDGVLGVLGFSVIPNHEQAIRRAVALLREDGRIVICDGAPFQGLWRVLNPIVMPIYRRLACWNPQKDILGALNKVVTDLDVQWFNGGSVYITTGKKGLKT